MKRKFTFTILLLIPLFNSNAIDFAPNTVKATNFDTSYIRFENEGDYWKYNCVTSTGSGNSSWTLKIQIGHVTNFHGKVCIPYIHTNTLNDITVKHYYHFTSEGREYLGDVSSDGNEVFYDPGILFPYNLNGTQSRPITCLFNGSTPEIYDQSEYIYNFAGEESLALPANPSIMHTNRLSFRINMSRIGDNYVRMSQEYDEWYVSELGLIKNESTDSHGNLINSWTLIEAKVGNKVFP